MDKMILMVKEQNNSDEKFVLTAQGSSEEEKIKKINDYINNLKNEKHGLVNTDSFSDLDIYNGLLIIEKFHNTEMINITEQTDYDYETVLLDKDLITRELTDDTWSDYANYFLLVSDLKKILKENHVKSSGKKQDLIDRISKNNLIPYSSYLPDYYLTKKGKEFTSKNKWMDTYKKYLNKFYLNDFITCQDDYEDNLYDSMLEYLDKFISKSGERKSFTELKDSLDAKIKICRDLEKKQDLLQTEIMLFIVYVNKLYAEGIFLIEKHFNEENIAYLIETKAKITEELFNSQWDGLNITDERFSRKYCWEILCDMLDGASKEEYDEKLRKEEQMDNVEITIN